MLGGEQGATGTQTPCKQSFEVFYSIFNNVMKNVYKQIDWIEAGHKAIPFSLQNVTQDVFTILAFQTIKYDFSQTMPVEDQEPLPTSIDPWGQPKLKIEKRKHIDQTQYLSVKRKNTTQSDDLSERKKSFKRRSSTIKHLHSVQEREKIFKSSGIMLQSTSEHQQVRQFQRQNSKAKSKTPTKNQIPLVLNSHIDQFSEEYTPEIEQQLRQRMAIYQEQKKIAQEERAKKAASRRKIGGFQNLGRLGTQDGRATVSSDVMRQVSRQIRQLVGSTNEPATTQESFGRRSSMRNTQDINNSEGQAPNNSAGITAYKFTFDYSGSLMLTKKPIIRADRNTMDPKNVLSYQVSDAPAGRNQTLHKGKLDELNKTNFENLDGTNLLTDRKSNNNLKTNLISEQISLNHRGSILHSDYGDNANKKKQRNKFNLHSEKPPLISDLTDVQPPPSKALTLNGGVNLVQDGKKPILGPIIERGSRMTLDEYQTLIMKQENISDAAQMRFKNLHFFKKKRQEQKKNAVQAKTFRNSSSQGLGISTKSRFKLFRDQRLNQAHSNLNLIQNNQIKASNSSAYLIDKSMRNIDQSINTYDTSAEENFVKIMDQDLIFKTKQQIKDNKRNIYQSKQRINHRNASYNPRVAAKIKYISNSVLKAARKLVNDRPYSPTNRAVSNSLLQSLTNRGNSPYSQNQRNLLNHSAIQPNHNKSSNTLSIFNNRSTTPGDDYRSKGVIIHYSEQERNSSKKGGMKRIPVSKNDSFNQSFLRGEIVANRDNASSFFERQDGVGVPAMLPKVHRDQSKKEFYYGRSKDPIKIAKSDVNLLDISGRGDKSTELIQNNMKSGLLRAGQSGMIGHKMPRERDMVQGMKKNDSIIGEMKLKEQEIKEKKIRKMLNERIKNNPKQSGGFNSTKNNYLKEMLRDTSLTFLS